MVNKIIKAVTGVQPTWGFYGGSAVIWVITWMIFPLIFLMTFDSFSDEDVFHKEAAMSLGANPVKSFFHIELPLAMPGILTGMLMAALAAFADFGTPAVIGGEFPLLPTAVYNEFVSEVGGNMGMASTVGIVMIFLSTIMLYAQRTILAKKTYAAVSIKRYTLAKPNKGCSIIIRVYIAVVLIMSFLPHVTLCVVSFMEWKYGVLMGTFTTANYQKLFEQQMTPIWMTFALGLAATFLTFVFGIGIAYLIVRKRYKVISGFINSIIMVPYVIPGTVLAVGFIMIFNKEPFLLTGTWDDLGTQLLYQKAALSGEKRGGVAIFRTPCIGRSGHVLWSDTPSLFPGYHISADDQRRDFGRDAVVPADYDGAVFHHHFVSSAVCDDAGGHF